MFYKFDIICCNKNRVNVVKNKIQDEVENEKIVSKTSYFIKILKYIYVFIINFIFVFESRCSAFSEIL